MVVFGQSGCIGAEVDVFGKNRLYSGKVVVFWQDGCIRERRFYSGKVVVFGQN